MKHFAYLILTLLLVFSGCTSTESSKDKNDIPTEPGIKWFRDMQKGFEKENNEYKSYWNDFLFNDALLVASKQTEEKFAIFLLGLYKLDVSKYRDVQDNAFMQEHINILMEKVTGFGVNDRFIALAEKYLYEPNSPYYNDELYLFFLKL